MKLSLFLLTAAVFCTSVLRAGPVSIFSTLGSGYNASAGFAIGDGGIEGEGESVAISFTVPAADLGFAYALTDIQFAGSTGDTTDAVHVALYSDASGVPGSALESLTKLLGTDPAVVTVNSVSNPVLTSGAQYWVVLSDSLEEATWNNSNASILGVDLLQFGSGWSYSGSYLQGAVEVDATEVPSTAPEPGTLLGLSTGLCAMLMLSRRRGGN